MKKARKWLEENQIPYQFHDYRVDGITSELLNEFESNVGWEAMLNKRGTTYRQLSDDIKNTLNKDVAMTLMLAQPAMIKRPLLIHQSQYFLGFKAEQYQPIFS